LGAAVSRLAADGDRLVAVNRRGQGDGEFGATVGLDPEKAHALRAIRPDQPELVGLVGRQAAQAVHEQQAGGFAGAEVEAPAGLGRQIGALQVAADGPARR